MYRFGQKWKKLDLYYFKWYCQEVVTRQRLNIGEREKGVARDSKAVLGALNTLKWKKKKPRHRSAVL